MLDPHEGEPQKKKIKQNHEQSEIDQLAQSNADQVVKIRRILEELGMEIASPADARSALQLKGGDRVKF